MPAKRSSVSSQKRGTTPTHPAQGKTERSHEENQERAYIAASRRSDRSVEARVQSAHMASDIHKKRTGKSFRITELIVRNEEMYEEEEDEFPRSYRLLGPHMQTSSSDMNQKLEAYMSTRMAMRTYMERANASWQHNDVNQQFAAIYPNYTQHAQDLQATQLQHNPSETPLSPGGQLNPFCNTSLAVMTPPVSSIDYAGPPSPMTYASPTEETTFGSPGPCDINTATPFGSSESAFTNELPGEMKLMMGGPPAAMDMNNLYDQNFYGQDFMQPEGMPGYYNPTMAADVTKSREFDQPPSDLLSHNWDSIESNYDWESLINENIFDSTQSTQG